MTWHQRDIRRAIKTHKEDLLQIPDEPEPARAARSIHHEPPKQLRPDNKSRRYISRDSVTIKQADRSLAISPLYQKDSEVRALLDRVRSEQSARYRARRPYDAQLVNEMRAIAAEKFFASLAGKRREDLREDRPSRFEPHRLMLDLHDREASFRLEAAFSDHDNEIELTIDCMSEIPQSLADFYSQHQSKGQLWTRKLRR